MLLNAVKAVYINTNFAFVKKVLNFFNVNCSKCIHKNKINGTTCRLIDNF